MKLSDEELSLFELAFALNISVSELLKMSYQEYIGWCEYFTARPLGWREDNRTMMLLRTQNFLRLQNL